MGTGLTLFDVVTDVMVLVPTPHLTEQSVSEIMVWVRVSNALKSMYIIYKLSLNQQMNN